MDLVFVRNIHGVWEAGDPITEDFSRTFPVGKAVHGDFKQMRNYPFHKKFFSLLQLGFEYFDPPEIDTKWGKPVKNFDTFRKNVTILAGYGEPVFNIDGTFKMEAKSISFARMDQGEFEKLYNAVVNVLLQRIPVLGQMGPEEIDRVTDKVLGFA